MPFSQTSLGLELYNIVLIRFSDIETTARRPYRIPKAEFYQKVAAVLYTHHHDNLNQLAWSGLYRAQCCRLINIFREFFARRFQTVRNFDHANKANTEKRTRSLFRCSTAPPRHRTRKPRVLPRVRSVIGDSIHDSSRVLPCRDLWRLRC